MSMKQEKDSIAISVEVKYIIHGGEIGTLDEVTPFRTLRDEVQRMIQVVKDKKQERTEAVFNSIESKLESIVVNIQKLKDPKQVCAGNEAKKFMEDLREGEIFVRNCMSKSKKCCFCIETSKPQFLSDELQRFDSCLESFNRIVVHTLEVEARNSIKKTQSETRNNSLKIPEEINKKPEELMQSKNPNRSTYNTVLSPTNDNGLAPTSENIVSLTCSSPAAPVLAPTLSGDSNKHPEQKKVLTRSNAMPKQHDYSNPSENNGSTVGHAAYLDQLAYAMPPEAKGLNEKNQSSNQTQRKDVQPHNRTHSSISPIKARDVQPNNFTHSSISSNTSRDVHQNNFTHSSISSNTSRDYNKEKDPTPAITNSTTASTLLVPLKPPDRVAGFSTSGERKKEKDLASAADITASTVVVPLKPSDCVDGLNTSREFNKEKQLPSAGAAVAVRRSPVRDLDKEFYRDSQVRGFEYHKDKRATDSSDV